MGKKEDINNVVKWARSTFDYNNYAQVCLPIGYYANVLYVGGGIGIAISTDGVGTKILVAQQLKKFDTIGIDCVAMNVNDVLCVGARPISIVDYIAVEKISSDFIQEIGVGLREGAKQAMVNIPAGETAQIPEMIRGVNNDSGFDLVGTCIGVVSLGKINTGENVLPGDIVIGLHSNGIHSNGFTLARKVLFEYNQINPDSYIEELGQTLGEELLKPTFIYVKPILKLMDNGIDIKALSHITGGGLMNLSRVEAQVGFFLDSLPEPPTIFKLIQEQGNVPNETMYSTFNMGIGFCVIVNSRDVGKTLQSLIESKVQARVIGKVVEDNSKTVRIKTKSKSNIILINEI